MNSAMTRFWVLRSERGFSGINAPGDAGGVHTGHGRDRHDGDDHRSIFKNRRSIVGRFDDVVRGLPPANQFQKPKLSQPLQVATG